MAPEGAGLTTARLRPRPHQEGGVSRDRSRPRAGAGPALKTLSEQTHGSDAGHSTPHKANRTARGHKGGNRAVHRTHPSRLALASTGLDL